MFRSRMHKLIFGGIETAASLVRPIMNRVAVRQAQDIQLERQRRALASTVDYVQRHMRHVKAVKTKFELLSRAFAEADVSGNRLICEFGVFQGTTINHIARLTQKTVFGFDSFEGLPEEWRDGNVRKGHFSL